MNNLRIRLEHLMCEDPKVWIYPPREKPTLIPGTNISYQYVIDFRMERWADKKTYGEAAYHLSHEGFIGLTASGVSVFFHVTRDGDAVVREATPEEAKNLWRLPDGWEKRIRVDVPVLRMEE